MAGGDKEEPVFVYTTWPNAERAEAAGRTLVEGELAACVNILPGMRSVYRWKGAIEVADEAVMIVKTLRSRVEALTIEIVERHPYDTPAIVVLPTAGGYAAYLDWIVAESSGGSLGKRG